MLNVDCLAQTEAGICNLMMFAGHAQLA